jgi:glycine cleavage system H protein
MRIEHDLFYTEEHEWVQIDENIATVGIDDYAQDKLGDVVYVELPEVGDEFEMGEAFASVESVKAASDVYMPLSGTVIEINEVFEEDPALLNEDPYAHWLVKIEMSDPSEVDELLSAMEYKAILDDEA